MWSNECESSFNRVKRILSSEPVLVSPDFKKPFVLFVDANDFGVGAVLQQVGDQDILHPIGYFSKKLNGAQLKYSTIEKEALSLVLALNHFDVYLCTTVAPVEVYTDHNPIIFINRMKNKNQRLLRWGLALQSYNLIIRHVPGSKNIIADALSRSQDPDQSILRREECNGARDWSTPSS